VADFESVGCRFDSYRAHFHVLRGCIITAAHVFVQYRPRNFVEIEFNQRDLLTYYSNILLNYQIIAILS
jgi:hypothetical protein